MTNGFTNNALAYITPTLFGGLTANAAIYLDDTSNNKHDTNFGIQYVAHGMTGGVQHAIIGNGSKTSNSTGIANTTGVESSTRVYAGYATDVWSLKGSYEFQRAQAANGIDVDYIYVSGTYKIMDDVKLATSVGVVEDGPLEGIGWQTGVFYNILPKTEVYLLYSGTYLDTAAQGDAESLVFGVSHKFALSH